MTREIIKRHHTPEGYLDFGQSVFNQPFFANRIATIFQQLNPASLNTLLQKMGTETIRSLAGKNGGLVEIVSGVLTETALFLLEKEKATKKGKFIIPPNIFTEATRSPEGHVLLITCARQNGLANKLRKQLNADSVKDILGIIGDVFKDEPLWFRYIGDIHEGKHISNSGNQLKVSIISKAIPNFETWKQQQFDAKIQQGLSI